MAYIQGNREQAMLFPMRVEDWVKEDDVVRVYDAFVESLDLRKLGIVLNFWKQGRPEYYPKAMLKLLLYGYSYGIYSSRKLERAVHHNIPFIWLMSGLKPDHKTIAEFRRKNKGVLKYVFKQCAKLCIKLNLIEGNTLFVDGTKIRANAGIDKTMTKEYAKELIEKLDKQIKWLLDECEKVDQKEKNNPSLIKLQEELNTKEKILKKVTEAINILEEEDLEQMNTTDPDCMNMHSRQGSHAGYNAQAVADEKYGLIVNIDVVKENTDTHQFSNQINQANEIIEEETNKKCETAVADAGYYTINELKKIDDQNIEVIVPSHDQARHKALGEEEKKFKQESFKYDSDKDVYICPQNQILKFISYDKDKECRKYRVIDSNICKKCIFFNKCTKSENGRQISRSDHEKLKIKLKNTYDSEKGKAIFRLRKQKIELLFGHIKKNIGFPSFFLRGLDGVNAEMSLLATGFNIKRMISILTIPNLMKELA